MVNTGFEDHAAPMVFLLFATKPVTAVTDPTGPVW
jgi:hypothetical protein